MAGTSPRAYDRIDENPFRAVTDHDTSTFSIDVDTASYAVVRSSLTAGRLPPRDATGLASGRLCVLRL